MRRLPLAVSLLYLTLVTAFLVVVETAHGAARDVCFYLMLATTGIYAGCRFWPSPVPTEEQQ